MSDTTASRPDRTEAPSTVTAAPPWAPSPGRHRGTAWVDAWREPLLTAAEEVELARRIEAGVLARAVLDEVPGSAQWLPPDATADDLRQLVAEGEQARDRFQRSNIGLVLKVVREVTRDADDDMVQQGCLALAEAVERFDTARGVKFSTLAHGWVARAVAAAHRHRNSVLSTPDGRLRDLALVGATRAAIQEAGGVDHVEAVADRLGRSPAWVRAHWSQVLRAVPDIGELADLATPDPGTPTSEPSDWWLDELPADEAWLLTARFGLRGHPRRTYAELERDPGATPRAVREREAVALAHVRDLVVHGEFEAGGSEPGEWRSGAPCAGVAPAPAVLHACRGRGATTGHVGGRRAA